MLSLNGIAVPFVLLKLLTRTYTFISPSSGEALFWKADGLLTDDFKLVEKKNAVVARFHDKACSGKEVGGKTS